MPLSCGCSGLAALLLPYRLALRFPVIPRPFWHASGTARGGLRLSPMAAVPGQSGRQRVPSTGLPPTPVRLRALRSQSRH